MKLILTLMILSAADLAIGKLIFQAWDAKPFELWRVVAFLLFCGFVCFNGAVLSVMDDKRKDKNTIIYR